MVGEQVGTGGVIDRELLCLAAEKLALEPCHLGGQFHDAGVERIHLLPVLLLILGAGGRQCGDGTLVHLYGLSEYVVLAHCPYLSVIV